MPNSTQNPDQNEFDSKSQPQGNALPNPERETGDSLINLWLIILENKLLVGAIIIASVIIAVAIAFTREPVYRADTLLAPTSTDSNSRRGLNAFASQFGGLASLAGVSMGDGSNINTAIATLKSRKFITQFIDEFKLTPILFEKQWSKETKQWKVKKPSNEKVYKKFSKNMLNVTRNQKTRLITVSLEWKDPNQAAQWLNNLIKKLNEELRQQTIDNAKRSIAYLQEQVNETSLAELQNMLYRIIEEHTKNITLAKVNDEYVMKVIDPAVPPETRSKPNRKLIVSFGFLIGVMLGVFLALVANNKRKIQIERDQYKK